MQNAYDEERNDWRTQRQTMKDSFDHALYAPLDLKLHEKLSYRRQNEQQALKIDELESTNRRQQAEIELLIVSLLSQLFSNRAI